MGKHLWTNSKVHSTFLNRQSRQLHILKLQRRECRLNQSRLILVFITDFICTLGLPAFVVCYKYKTISIIRECCPKFNKTSDFALRIDNIPNDTTEH